MQAIAALVQAMGAEFQKYMEAFYPFLDKGLKNFQEYQVRPLGGEDPSKSNGFTSQPARVQLT